MGILFRHNKQALRTREEDPEIRDRIKMGGLTQTAPVGWTPEGWECIDVDRRMEYGHLVIIRIWERP